MFAALQAATLPDLTGNRKYVHDDSYFYDQDDVDIDDVIDPLAYIDNPYDDPYIDDHDVYGDHDLDDYDIGDYDDDDDDEDDY